MGAGANIIGVVGTTIGGQCGSAAPGTQVDSADVNTPFTSFVNDLATIRDSTGVGGKVSRTGDTMTGTLTLTCAGVAEPCIVAVCQGAGNAAAISGVGHGTGVGVTGTGGATNGTGVTGVGIGTGSGMIGEGDQTSAATGSGVKGVGADSGPGVTGVGGATVGPGGTFAATAGNSSGVVGNGHGTGAGGDFTGGASAPAVIARGAAVSIPTELLATADPGGNGMQFATNICKSWGQIESDGVGGKGVNDSYNLGTLTLSTGPGRFTIAFARAMTTAFYSVSVTLHSSNVLHAVPLNLATTGFDIEVVNGTGTAQDPASNAFTVSYQVFGRST